MSSVVRELPGAREPAGVGVDVVRRLDEQLQQCGVGVGARHEHGGG